ncbi:ATP-dependent RecD-like DNA helicase [Oleisolibacter albus]|uniref:SF1B family DNA helicase RecD2 n=1 Tax=Oleisolibacter albus TaxID=2171757 RepID=UPI000DF2F024|nr:ATP-dependent RecD-like DNA helicase [Oleisolibacter albus]
MPFDSGFDDRYELTGQVERVTFRNPETGFSVLKVKAGGHRKPVALVVHGPVIEPGERVRAVGAWVQDGRYGLQFRAAAIAASPPSTADGIERYLGSGLVEGVGPIHAARLVDAFGDRTLAVIEQEPWRLHQIAGIGPARADSILKAWERQRTLRDLTLFLSRHGVATDRVLRLHQTYGAGALDLLRRDPYRAAAEVEGFHFGQADALARALGLPADAPVRLEAGLRHVLDLAADEGQCGLAETDLLDRAAMLLAVETPKLARVLTAASAAGQIVRETVAGEACVFPAGLHGLERTMARRLVEQACGTPPWYSLLHADPAARDNGPAEGPVACSPAIAAILDRLAAETGLVLAPAQAAALTTILASKLSILTGGPGVGKTVLVTAVVRVLAAQGLRIALAAPTGRSAKRLQQATGHDASTVHRLLEVGPEGAFRRGPERPLDVDLLVLDEASMLDVRLLAAVLDALPARAGLLLVGDADQLPSVGPGQVLADLITSAAVPVVRLREVFRQAAASRIVAAAHRIRNGQRPDTVPPGADSDFYMLETRSADVTLARILEMVKERIPGRFGLDPRRDIQVLCPMNKGSLGTRALNLALQQALNPPTGPRVARGPWQFGVGDKVMQVENDHERAVYNGDIGTVVAVDVPQRAIEVAFDDGTLRYADAELDRLVLAYASSIHKAQGLEFPAVIIPLTLQHRPMLQRALLYTGITRGRRLVVLVGDRQALDLAITNAPHPNGSIRPRRSTLALRLREAQGQMRRSRSSRIARPTMTASSNGSGLQAESVLAGTNRGG